MHMPPSVFVLELPLARDLAFEAGSVTQAFALTRSPWFIEAVNNFLEGARPCRPAFDAQRIRAATAVEEGIYCKLREELDGFNRQFLVADLSGFRERHVAGSVEALV
jgi:hypothetical protein